MFDDEQEEQSEQQDEKLWHNAGEEAAESPSDREEDPFVMYDRILAAQRSIADQRAKEHAKVHAAQQAQQAAQKAEKAAKEAALKATRRAAMDAIVADPVRLVAGDLESLRSVTAWLRTHQRIRLTVKAGPARDALKAADALVDQQARERELERAAAEAANSDLARRLRKEPNVPVPPSLLKTIADVDAVARWLVANWESVVRCDIPPVWENDAWLARSNLLGRLVAWTVWFQLDALATAQPDLAERTRAEGMTLVSEFTNLFLIKNQEPELAGGVPPDVKPECMEAMDLWLKRTTPATASSESEDSDTASVQTSNRRSNDRVREEAVQKVYRQWVNKEVRPTAKQILAALRDAGAKGQDGVLLAAYREYEANPTDH